MGMGGAVGAVGGALKPTKPGESRVKNILAGGALGAGAGAAAKPLANKALGMKNPLGSKLHSAMKSTTTHNPILSTAQSGINKVKKLTGD